MVITDFLERNARLYGSDTALVEVNPSEERDSAVTWREASLIAEAQPTRRTGGSSPGVILTAGPTGSQTSCSAAAWNAARRSAFC